LSYDFIFRQNSFVLFFSGFRIIGQGNLDNHLESSCRIYKANCRNTSDSPNVGCLTTWRRDTTHCIPYVSASFAEHVKQIEHVPWQQNSGHKCWGFSPCNGTERKMHSHLMSSCRTQNRKTKLLYLLRLLLHSYTIQILHFQPLGRSA
jgi:hypothetical protein